MLTNRMITEINKYKISQTRYLIKIPIILDHIYNDNCMVEAYHLIR